jgi:hypothetical protein
MAVGYDSPEAFEEVLWRASWPSKFMVDAIDLWSDDEDAHEFRQLLVSQMQRIIAARSNGSGRSRRYLSKNNANIARLGLLKRLFPDAVLLVPFRNPIDQAGSLLRQHERFLQVHRDDDFARQYMDDIGHLEFGALHRPIRFAGMREIRDRYHPETIDYWLAYWIVAFTHVLRHRERITLVSYAELCQAGAAGVRTLAMALDVPGEMLEGIPGADLHEPRSHRPETLPTDPALLDEAEALHQRLSTCRLALSQSVSQ